MFLKSLVFLATAIVSSNAACTSVADCNARQCLDCTCSDGKCVCTDGYSGPNCETPFCVNRTNGCSGHGECNMQRSSITCTCDTGFSGKHCSVQPCPLKCERGSVPNVPNSTCTYCVNCPPGYNGTTCSEWSNPTAALTAAKSEMVALRTSVESVLSNLANPAFCSNGHECVGWGVNFVTGEPLALPFNVFNFSQHQSFEGILCPDGSTCTYHSGALEPVFTPPSGAKAYIDVLDFASQFDQLRATNTFQRGPFAIDPNGTILMTSMSPSQANSALFNKPPGDRAATVSQATFLFVDIELKANTSLAFNDPMNNILRGLPPSYADAEQFWDTIFEELGTHVVVSGSMGGILEMQSFWKTELLQMDKYNIPVLEAQSKLAFAAQTGLLWPAGTAAADPVYTANTETVFNCFAGNDTLCPSSTGAAVTKQWIASVRENPLLAQYKIDRLSKYMTESSWAEAWDSAVDAYIQKKQAAWDAQSKCPASCTNSQSGAVGTCSGTLQTACECPCHQGRTCTGPGVCLDSVCCPATESGGGCDYHLSTEEEETDPHPEGDGNWGMDKATSHFPTVVHAHTHCYADWLGMHCDCEVPFPFPTVEYGVSDWHWPAGCGGSCDRTADVTVHSKIDYSKGGKCKYPQPCKAQKPQSRKQFDRAIDNALLSGNRTAAYTLAKDAVSRGFYPSAWQRPSRAFVPGVHSTFFPVVDATTPYIAELEAPGVLRTIQEEVEAFNHFFAASSSGERTGAFRNTVTGTKTGLHYDVQSDTQTEIEPASWGQVLLMDRRLNFTKDARKYFPRTVKVLEAAVRRSSDQITHMPPGGIVLARLPPHVSIRAHVGLTNARLRVSYGVFVPKTSGHGVGQQPAVGIRVGNETRTWREGKALILDDSYEHSAWNNGDTDRIVLLADFWHPGLTRSQRVALESGKFFYQTLEAGKVKMFEGNAWEKIRCQSSAKMWEKM